MKLYIDTKERGKSKISLINEGGEEIFSRIENESTNSSESIVVLIKETIEKSGYYPKDIDIIEVEKGPGSYTGTRIGVAIANALSFSLKIPLNYKEVGSLENPEY